MNNSWLHSCILSDLLKRVTDIMLSIFQLWYLEFHIKWFYAVSLSSDRAGESLGWCFDVGNTSAGWIRCFYTLGLSLAAILPWSSRCWGNKKNHKMKKIKWWWWWSSVCWKIIYFICNMTSGVFTRYNDYVISISRWYLMKMEWNISKMVKRDEIIRR